MCNIIKRLESRDRGLLPPSARFVRIHLPRQGGFWCSANSAYSAVPFAESDRFNGVTGVQGGLRGEIEIFPGPPAKKVIKMLICYLFVSTPQSIAKPSPGWNKVALLTAVRNSSCSCPFSVSLHPPLAALNSVPLRGAIVSMGLRGVQGALRGEIEIFPSPLQKGYKEALLFFVYLNPSVTACAVPAPRPGSLLMLPLTKSCSRKWGKCHGLRRLLPPTNHPHPARAFHPETGYPCRCSCPARPTGWGRRRFR